MTGFLYSLTLQWKLDIRSKSLLVTYYIVPLIFFLLMGGIFTSVMPEMDSTLIQSMIVMSVSMGSFLGLPPSLIEIYGSDIKKIYKANGVPIHLGLVTMVLSAFVHLMITCMAILLLAPILFKANLPSQFPLFFLALAIYIFVSLSIGSILGLTVNNQAKLTMIAQLIFLPSIMLSGIMFPITLLPDFLQVIGRLFPASWGFRLMVDYGFGLENLWYLARLSAEVTHNHPEGVKGAMATSDAIFMCRYYFGGYSGDYGKPINDNPTECKRLIKEHIEQEYGYNLSQTLDDIRPTYRFNETCQNTVPQAIIAFLESTDFEDAIRNAISLGGDSDTLAAITGSIAEAAYGIPDWIKDKAYTYLDEPLKDVLSRWEQEVSIT